MTGAQETTRQRARWLALLCALILPTVVVAQADPTGGSEGVDFFEKRIRPVLVERCYRCHSREAKNLSANLRLDSRRGWLTGGDSGPAIVPGKPEASRVMAALRHEGPKMPPDSRLPSRVVADFRTWIALGAPTPTTFAQAPEVTADPAGIRWEQEAKFWAFRPLAGRETASVAAELASGQCDRHVHQSAVG